MSFRKLGFEVRCFSLSEDAHSHIPAMTVLTVWATYRACSRLFELLDRVYCRPSIDPAMDHRGYGLVV